MSNGAADGSGALLAIAAQVRQLQAQVAALAGQTTGEALVPNYLTVDPQGRTGAAFSGLINALGLILPMTEDFTVSPINEITWEADTDGAQLAHIQADSGFSGVQQTFLNMLAQPRSGGGDGATVSLQALNTLNQFGAELSASTANSGGAGDSLTMQTAHHDRVLLDDTGNSDFLGVIGQDGLRRNFVMTFGTVLATFAASTLSNIVTVNSGLAGTPVWAGACCGTGGTVAPISTGALTNSLIPGQATFRAWSSAAVTGTLNLFWALVSPGT